MDKHEDGRNYYERLLSDLGATDKIGVTLLFSISLAFLTNITVFLGVLAILGPAALAAGGLAVVFLAPTVAVFSVSFVSAILYFFVSKNFSFAFATAAIFGLLSSIAVLLVPTLPAAWIGFSATLFATVGLTLAGPVGIAILMGVAVFVTVLSLIGVGRLVYRNVNPYVDQVYKAAEEETTVEELRERAAKDENIFTEPINAASYNKRYTVLEKKVEKKAIDEQHQHDITHIDMTIHSRRIIKKIEPLIQDAGKGNSDAAYKLGIIFARRYDQYDQEQDLERAKMYWEQAANATPPHIGACYELAICLLQDNDKKDHYDTMVKKAKEGGWLEKLETNLADLEITAEPKAETQYQLARCYRYGVLVEKDETKAVDYYKEAILTGDHGYAAYDLANIYKNGLYGVSKSEEAYRWLIKKAGYRGVTKVARQVNGEQKISQATSPWKDNKAFLDNRQSPRKETAPSPS